MDAETGSNPSYNWRSLWAAGDVIKEGSKWQVGDGSDIEVSNHKWLTHKPVFLGDTQPNLLVKDLIDSTTRQWDREKIFDLFTHKTRILQFPLTQLYSRDRPVWKENRSQKFSVKSAYQVAQRMRELDRVEHSGTVADRGVWRQLWSLNVPPKVQMFVWRACSNILPTRDNLHCRKINIDPWCEFCCQQLEYAAHFLWECPFARNVWALCRGKIQKCSNHVQDFFHVISLFD